MHINVYSEDMEVNDTVVVKKKGFYGLKISFGHNEQITFWHKNPLELSQIFEGFALMLETQPTSAKLRKAIKMSTRVR